MSVLIKYTTGYKYKLHEDAAYQVPIRLGNEEIITQFLTLTKNGLLKIRKGFAWDGASGAVDTNTNMSASLVHDALCYLINYEHLPRLYQIVADKVFYDICLESGMAKPRAWYHHRAIRRFDRSGLKKYEKKEVLTAP